ncbi:class I SAM-dependent methyltransferase [Pontiella sulfatireligans]|uniref:Uncharacterized protein n=1 Tax=Pontiella sulfatireligans TaxID=2750658 RepID=A0A6C2UM27_9BACT|nr:methyltransferase domain-containing protein [Pontiella sulfatireligans]VGO21029.1 hypothetical protein SCARR_03098 [Pontiella sulfatireligans]
MIRASIIQLYDTFRTKQFLNKIGKDNLDAKNHLDHAFSASRRRRPYLAYAELKTAEYLGADQKQVEKYKAIYRRALPDPKLMSHNQYFRFKTLASEIMERSSSDKVSVLDVGGGEGGLAAFLPENASYCLADPNFNGISGENLPFTDHSFDHVISCHVLEHIPMNERYLFLDQLLSKSRSGVILLNPFHAEGTQDSARLKFIIKLTGVEWAKEHLECTLPRIEDLQEYASDRGLDICVTPNGTMATTTAFVFLDYFASKSGLKNDWKEVNAFFNEKYSDILDSPEYPTAYLVYLGHPKK